MNILLYLTVVVVWGASWLAIKFQVAALPPDLSVLYRFALAAALILPWAVLRRSRLRYSLGAHGLMAVMGLCMFSANYLLFYTATAAGLTTGLIALLFSTVVIMNLINERIWFGRAADPRMIAAAMLGIAGIAVVFWPDIMALDSGEPRILAILLSLLASYCFSLGNMASAQLQARGLPIVPTVGIAMAYGTATTLLYVLATGRAFEFDLSASFLASLAFLVVFGTVIAFGAYLTLLGRIGAARASYATILFPLIALGLSTLFEGYQWTPSALVGVAMILAGNVVLLARPPATGRKATALDVG